MNQQEREIIEFLKKLLDIPSPTMHVEKAVQYLEGIVGSFGYKTKVSRRGDLVAYGPHTQNPTRAIAIHVDTLGAMVTHLKDNGRLSIHQVGNWSARFATGARVKVEMEDGRQIVGTILPNKASGHGFGEEVLTQGCEWTDVEVRIDERCHNKEDLVKIGLQVGDWVFVEPQLVVTENGFINSRYVDNKAPLACLLEVMKNEKPMEGIQFIFTGSEENGLGIGALLDDSVEELLNVDIAVQTSRQNNCYYGLSIVTMDAAGPMHPKATQRLVDVCRKYGIEYTKDVYKRYGCDGDSALRAGKDFRNALICISTDASHAWERTHIDSLVALSKFIKGWVKEWDSEK